MFYEHPDDLGACREFMRENLQQNRARVFLVRDDAGTAVAFA